MKKMTTDDLTRTNPNWLKNNVVRDLVRLFLDAWRIRLLYFEHVIPWYDNNNRSHCQQ